MNLSNDSRRQLASAGVELARCEQQLLAGGPSFLVALIELLLTLLSDKAVVAEAGCEQHHRLTTALVEQLRSAVNVARVIQQCCPSAFNDLRP